MDKVPKCVDKSYVCKNSPKRVDKARDVETKTGVSFLILHFRKCCFEEGQVLRVVLIWVGVGAVGTGGMGCLHLGERVL